MDTNFFLLDINECSAGSDRCHQNCHNAAGSYACSCYSGYRLNSDGVSCRGKAMNYIYIFFYQGKHIIRLRSLQTLMNVLKGLTDVRIIVTTLMEAIPASVLDLATGFSSTERLVKVCDKKGLDGIKSRFDQHYLCFLKLTTIVSYIIIIILSFCNRYR